MIAYLARPTHALPYTEVAYDPGQQQSESQLPAHAARVVKTVGDPQSVTSENQPCHYINGYAFCTTFVRQRNNHVLILFYPLDKSTVQPNRTIVYPVPQWANKVDVFNYIFPYNIIALRHLSSSSSALFGVGASNVQAPRSPVDSIVLLLSLLIRSESLYYEH